MLPCAYVVHQIRGRVRLRVREKRQDAVYFEEVRRQLGSLSGIDEVRINSTTGTVLLLHPEQPYGPLSDQLRQLGLFKLIDGPEPVPSALAPLSSGISMIDKVITGGSGGSVDIRTLAYIGLMAFTIRQVMRGELLGPALPMLWQALSLVDRINGWKDHATREAVDPGNSQPVSDGDS